MTGRPRFPACCHTCGEQYEMGEGHRCADQRRRQSCSKRQNGETCCTSHPGGWGDGRCCQCGEAPSDDVSAPGGAT